MENRLAALVSSAPASLEEALWGRCDVSALLEEV